MACRSADRPRRPRWPPPARAALSPGRASAYTGPTPQQREATGMAFETYPDPEATLAALRAAARERILILDGAMGTQIQGLGLAEEDFRGHRFHACDHHLQGNNDLLILTQPEAVEEIHYRYAKAGADIIETNTFSS